MTKSEFIVAIIAVTVLLCIPAFGQTNADNWYNIGTALSNQGKYDEALQAYDKAIQLNPNLVWSWNDNGAVLQNHNKYIEAMEADMIEP